MNSEKLFNKNFTIMSVGQFISLFGNSLQRFALSLYILDLTGSATIFSVILALSVLPQIFLAPFGGAFADRFDKKKIMVFLDTFSGIFLLGFLIFLQTIGASGSSEMMGVSGNAVIPIAVLMCVMAVIQSVYDPSVRASIPAVTASANLASANSVVSIVSSLTGLLGPIAAGFLYGLYGIRAVFIINIVSFFASAIMELFLQIPHTRASLNGPIVKTFAQDIKHSVSYLYHEKPVIFQMILVASSFNLFLTPIYTVGLPFMEKLIFGATDQMYGISEGVVGAGMVVGALLLGVISKKFPFQKLYCYFYLLIFLVLGMGACAVPGILSKNGTSYLSYGLFTCIGFIFAMVLALVNILCMTYMQLEIPMEYMGKCMALITACSTALMPIGQIVFGRLYDIFKSTTWVIYIIVAMCCVVLTCITTRLIRQADATGSLRTDM